jgi:hypothetical protein
LVSERFRRSFDFLCAPAANGSGYGGQVEPQQSMTHPNEGNLFGADPRFDGPAGHPAKFGDVVFSPQTEIACVWGLKWLH